MDKALFIKKFADAIYEGNAAIFAGAGTSVDAGFVNWKKLVEPFASEINLDIEKETDLIGLTQYYINKKTLSRQSLLTHDRKRNLAYNEDEQYKSVVSNRTFPSLLKKLDEQES